MNENEKKKLYKQKVETVLFECCTARHYFLPNSDLELWKYTLIEIEMPKKEHVSKTNKLPFFTKKVQKVHQVL